MLAANKRQARADIKLSIAVLNEALSLRAHDVVGVIQYARRGWSSSDRGNHVVKLRWPANLGQVETRVVWRAVVGEAAETRVQRGDGGRRYVVVVTNRRGARGVLLRATILTKPGAQWVLRQIQNVPIGVAEENALVGAQRLIHPAYHLVLVSAG